MNSLNSESFQTEIKVGHGRVPHFLKRNKSVMRSLSTNQQILAGVITAIIAWSAVHTFGVWQHDRRGAIIVLAAVSLFFGLWILGFIHVRLTGSLTVQANGKNRRLNLTCLSAMISSLVSIALFVTEIVYRSNILYRSTSFGLATLAILLAIIGLSHPVIHRGKFYGVVGLGVALFTALASMVRFLVTG